MGVLGVGAVSVPVRDQDAALAFYTVVVGLGLVADQAMGPGKRWVQVGPPGATSTLTLVTWFDSMAPGSLKGLVLLVDDVDAMAARLAGAGAAPGPVEEAPWGRFVQCDDPDGNGLIFQQDRS